MGKLSNFWINLKLFWGTKTKSEKGNLIAVIALLTILPTSVAGVFTIKQFMGRAAYPVTPPITNSTSTPIPTNTCMICNNSAGTINTCSFSRCTEEGTMATCGTNKYCCSDGIWGSSYGKCLSTGTPRPTPSSTPQACVKKGQTISIIPNTQYGSLGQTLTYTVTIRNNDSATCPQSVFTLTNANLPTNWSLSFDNNQLSILPGKLASTKVRVKSATNAGQSNYTIYIRSKGSSFTVQSPLIYSIARIVN